MRKIIFILLLLAILPTFTYGQNRIIDGNVCDISQRPFQVFIAVNNGKSLGAGVIIDNQWILTAAHVIYNASVDSIKIVAGENTPIYYPLTAYSVSKTIIHPKYNDKKLENDIALIKLKEPILFNEKQQSIVLSDRISYPTVTTGVISGWGATSFYNLRPSFELKMATVNMIPFPNRAKIAITYNSGMSYKGDSGGPLTISFGRSHCDLAGIISSIRQKDNNPQESIAYCTNVGYYYNWIRQYVQHMSVSGPNILCGDDEYIINTHGGSIALSENLKITSQTGNKYQIEATGNGEASIDIIVGNRKVTGLGIWIGPPKIIDITIVDKYYHAVVERDRPIIQAKWNVGYGDITNNDTYYEIQPLQPYGQQYVYVRVELTNKCGTSEVFSKVIPTSDLPSTNSITYSIGSKLIKVDNLSSIIGKNGDKLTYKIISISTGQICQQGSLPSDGGNIDISSIPKGTYSVVLTSSKGHIQNIKINL